MFKVILLTVYGFLLSFGHCDLIGYNRLGNNVYTHRRLKNGVALGNYERQLNNWIVRHGFEVLPYAEKINQKTRNNNNRHNRLNHYKTRMASLT